MSFLRNTMEVGLTPPIEYHAGKANEAIVLGEALTLTAGALTKCGATAKPDYIAVGPVKEGTVPVIKVQDYILFDVPLTVAGTALKVGDKVTIAATGLGVTATTEGGVATIVAINGTAVGDTVTVRF